MRRYWRPYIDVTLSPIPHQAGAIVTRTLLLAAVGTLLHPSLLPGQGAADKEGVRKAVLDYVEGFYEGDTAKLVRSVRPEVVKYGYFIPKGKTAYAGEAMPWAEFMSYANSVKKSGKPTPASSPKEITLLDVADQTASAKLTAWWGIDYMHLAKFDGKWMITQVLWQSPPRAPR